jgi:hypothetical protein
VARRDTTAVTRAPKTNGANALSLSMAREIDTD